MIMLNRRMPNGMYGGVRGGLNSPYSIICKVDSMLGQLIVVSFLFYSGYGIMIPIIKEGSEYYLSIHTKRLFKVWYHFEIAIILFIFIVVTLGKDYNISKYMLAFTGWVSIGNSDWYVFAVL